MPVRTPRMFAPRSQAACVRLPSHVWGRPRSGRSAMCMGGSPVGIAHSSGLLGGINGVHLPLDQFRSPSGQPHRPVCSWVCSPSASPHLPPAAPFHKARPVAPRPAEARPRGCLDAMVAVMVHVCGAVAP
eukprot:364968-Chlamydomonas_euryale.AAC.5